MPDFDALSSEYTATGGTGAQGGTAPSSGGDSGSSASGETGTGGTSPSGGDSGEGSGDSGRGGASGETGSGGTPGGEGGSGGDGNGNDSGDGGEGVSGSATGATGGTAGEGGTGGSSGNAGAGGNGAAGNGGTGGTGGVGGEGGLPPTGCVDGCALLDVPFAGSSSQTQFFTIAVPTTDLTGAKITAIIRVLDYQGASGYVKVYATTQAFAYCCYTAPLYVLSSLTAPTTIELDLAAAPVDWDSTNVGEIGIQVAGSAVPVRLVLEEIRVSNDTLGPYAFESSLQGLAVNSYMPVPGATVTWIPAEQ